jgi:hypothetical protein
MSQGYSGGFGCGYVSLEAVSGSFSSTGSRASASEPAQLSTYIPKSGSRASASELAR